MKIGIFYGSTTGNTENAAEKIERALENHVSHIADIAYTEPNVLLNYDVLILGVPTWDVGQLQIDWETFLHNMDGLDLTDRKVALFGMGDSGVYSLNFLDALGLLWNEIKTKGNPELIGIWPTEGYEYDESLGKYDDDHFLGLGLDEENQMDLHDERISAWVCQLKAELQLD
tara:strand:+ start:2302 stop:2817 length:516 start_codon:yes stop_codon:yes gene_type:complete